MTFQQNSWKGTAILQNNIKGLCLVLDRRLMRIRAESAMEMAHAAGVSFFQYRDKEGTRRDVYETSLVLSRKARMLDAVFIVNDHADIARAVGAHGVHLGQDDLPIDEARKCVGPGAIIGISTHDEAQARIAERAGADYIGFGPIYRTATKDAGRVQGPEKLLAVRQCVHIPIIAIGGITVENIGNVLRSGANGAAIISAILSANDLQRAAGAFINKISEFESLHPE